MQQGDKRVQTLSVCLSSWNVAAVNNNPFEYWVSCADESYNVFMSKVEDLMLDAENDTAIHNIFSDSMFEALQARTSKADIPQIDDLHNVWSTHFRDRMAFAGFLNDAGLCHKRLLSMPDRVTNTIALADGSTCYRPTVINAYDGADLSSIEVWWGRWLQYMFETPICIENAADDTHVGLPEKPTLVCHLLSPLSRAKYPALTSDEEAHSVALQLLCLALLDAVLVHVANAAGRAIWQPLRRTLADALIRDKDERVCEVMACSCADADVVFLQEASAALVTAARRHPVLSARFALLAPRNLDARRNQNSLILVRRDAFDAAGWADATADVLDMAEGRWVAPGDLLAASVAGSDGRRWLLVSFHGDSCGLMTQPLLAAVDDAARARYPGHALLVGLDANPRSRPAAGGGWRAGAGAGCGGGGGGMSFEDFLAARRLASMWGSVSSSETAGLATTCSARTLLQVELGRKGETFFEREWARWCDDGES